MEEKKNYSLFLTLHILMLSFAIHCHFLSYFKR